MAERASPRASDSTVSATPLISGDQVRALLRYACGNRIGFVGSELRAHASEAHIAFVLQVDDGRGLRVTRLS
jgi:hypothetical protein